MELFLSDEFRLAYAAGLIAAAVIGAARFVSRHVRSDWADRAADVFLLVFLIQYLAVALPGVLGILSFATIAAMTVGFSAVLWMAGNEGKRKDQSGIPGDTATRRQGAERQKDEGGREKAEAKDGDEKRDGSFFSPPSAIVLLAALFLAGFSAAIIAQQRVAPVIANDAITYHFPAAVKWLQTGRLALFETWFFNPANTYSPLAGSTFIAWWMAPVGHDFLAKYVQFPAVGLIFFSLLRLMREMNVAAGVAAIVALAIVLAQPIVRQAAMEKDDLYLAGFFIAALAACAPRRLRDPLGPWRIGCAIGLMLATKYTALLAVPLLLGLIDAPWRAGWRAKRYTLALAVLLLIAGPWYLRNALLTGNPLYPLEVSIGGWTIFKGMFSTSPSVKFAGLGSTWEVLTQWHQSLPAASLAAVGAAWLAAVVVQFKQIRSDPLARVCLLGPPVMIGVFVLASPYPEARFVYPAFLLLYAAAGLAIAGWLRIPALQFVAAGVIFAASAGTGLPPDQRGGFFLAGALAAATGAGLAAIIAFNAARRRRIVAYCAIFAAVGLGLAIYTLTPGLVRGFFEVAPIAWNSQYSSEDGKYALSKVWEYIDRDVPPEKPLAYANSCLILPMTGLRHQRRLVYVPTRRGVEHLHDLPRIARRLSGETIVAAVAKETFADPDREQWLKRLAGSGASHIVVFLGGPEVPPELPMIAATPSRFELVYENPSGKVYRVRR